MASISNFRDVMKGSMIVIIMSHLHAKFVLILNNEMCEKCFSSCNILHFSVCIYTYILICIYIENKIKIQCLGQQILLLQL